jgi:hypothetical protein
MLSADSLNSALVAYSPRSSAFLHTKTFVDRCDSSICIQAFFEGPQPFLIRVRKPSRQYIIPLCALENSREDAQSSPCDCNVQLVWIENEIRGTQCKLNLKRLYVTGTGLALVRCEWRALVAHTEC